jgi:hypothetical protein
VITARVVVLNLLNMLFASSFELLELSWRNGAQKGQRLVCDLRDLSTFVAVGTANCNHGVDSG